MMHPELVAALRGNGPASKIHEHCDYLASRGASGLGALKSIVHSARRTDNWQASIPLHGCVMNAHVDVLRYLIDDVGVTALSQLDAVDTKNNTGGNTAMQHGVIWGRPSCCAFLLARGADARTLNAAGVTAAAMARTRQERLVEFITVRSGVFDGLHFHMLVDMGGSWGVTIATLREPTSTQPSAPSPL